MFALFEQLWCHQFDRFDMTINKWVLNPQCSHLRSESTKPVCICLIQREVGLSRGGYKKVKKFTFISTILSKFSTFFNCSELIFKCHSLALERRSPVCNKLLVICPGTTGSYPLHLIQWSSFQLFPFKGRKLEKLMSYFFKVDLQDFRPEISAALKSWNPHAGWI